MYSELLLPDLKLMLSEEDNTALREFCSVLNEVVIAEVLDGLEADEAWRVLKSCDVERQAEIFEHFPPRLQMELVASIDRPHLSKIVEAMSPDDRIDLLEHLEEDQIEQLLPLIAQAERDEIRKMLSYPEYSCGSIMTTEYASLPENITVREALDRVRQQAPERETIYYLYVVDESRHLHGVITLRELVLARPHQLLATVMRRDFVSVRVTDDQEVAANEIARFDLLAIPVLDEDSRLVGIITHDDVLDVVREEAEEDAYRQSAMEPLEYDYLETPLLTIAWKRGVWLLVLAAVAVVTATVLKAFDGASKRHGFLVLFLPLVLASGGNTGSQSATLVIRAMALSGTARRERLRMAWREFLTGLLLGSGLALFAFVAARGLFGLTAAQGSVVAGTVILVVTMGTVIGALLPLLFDHLGMDPAVMSNPLIASLSDIIGTFIYFSVAILVLEWL